MLKNSIDKLNQQIDMLQNKKFIEKTQIKKVKPIVKNRKDNKMANNNVISSCDIINFSNKMVKKE